MNVAAARSGGDPSYIILTHYSHLADSTHLLSTWTVECSMHEKCTANRTSGLGIYNVSL